MNVICVCLVKEVYKTTASYQSTPNKLNMPPPNMAQSLLNIAPLDKSPTTMTLSMSPPNMVQCMSPPCMVQRLSPPNLPITILNYMPNIASSTQDSIAPFTVQHFVAHSVAVPGSAAPYTGAAYSAVLPYQSSASQPHNDASTPMARSGGGSAYNPDHMIPASQPMPAYSVAPQISVLHTGASYKAAIPPVPQSAALYSDATKRNGAHSGAALHGGATYRGASQTVAQVGARAGCHKGAQPVPNSDTPMPVVNTGAKTACRPTAIPGRSRFNPNVPCFVPASKQSANRTCKFSLDAPLYLLLKFVVNFLSCCCLLQ